MPPPPRRRLLPSLALAAALATPVLATSSPAQSTPPHPHPAAEADTLFRTGSAAVTRGDFHAAEQAFTRLVQLAPAVAAAHAALGAVLLVEAKPAAALPELTRAHTLEPGDPAVTLNLALAHASTGNLAAAGALLHQLPPDTLAQAELAPADSLALARALASTGDRPAATALVLAALTTHPGNAPLLDAHGVLQAQAGELADAIGSFSSALAADPRLASAHAHLGSAELSTHHAHAAADELTTARQLGDTSPETTLQLARAQLADAQYPASIATLRPLVAANPPEPAATDARYTLALALQGNGNTHDALPLFAAVVAARPTSAPALINYGLALVQSGSAKQAIALYRRAELAAPPTPTLRENFGVAYLQQDDLAHAIEQFQAGLALDPNSANLHYDLGLAFKLKDDLGSSIPEFQRAEDLDPQLPDPPYTLGVLLMQQGRFADAEQQLERAVALRPGNGEAWSILATVQKQSDQPDRAEASLHHAIPLLPDQPGPHILLASILAQRGETAPAAAERKLAADLSRAAVTHQRAGFSLDSGRLLLSRGDLAAATVQFQAALAADPSLPEAHLALAEILDRQGRREDALDERRKAQDLANARAHITP